MKNQIKPQNQEKATLESLYALLEKGERDAQKRTKEFSRSLKESEEKFNREMKESREEFNRKIAEINEMVLKNDELIGGIGNSNGNVAEEYFRNAFKDDPTLNGQIYDTVSFNLHTKNKKKQIEGEFDLVLLNEESVAIIEIKYNLKTDRYFENGKMKNKFEKILNKINTFKALYPVYENHKFYLGIAALSFEKEIEERIIKEGIAVIKQAGDKMIINSENLKTF
jgi:hypothetical protein